MIKLPIEMAQVIETAHFLSPYIADFAKDEKSGFASFEIIDIGEFRAAFSDEIALYGFDDNQEYFTDHGRMLEQVYDFCIQQTKA